jgi:hypothetical protein
MSEDGPKAKKQGTLRWSADQGQTGRVPRDPRPPVVTRSGPAHNSPKPSLRPNQLNAGDASVTGAEQKTGPSAPSPTLSFGLV